MPTLLSDQVTAAPRFAEERWRAIEQAVRAAGRVEVSALARLHGVSEHTIRRDLSALVAQGLVKKTHGGAVLLFPDASPVPDDIVTMHETEIAAAAAARIEPYQTVFIDSSSAAVALAKALAVGVGRRPLTVITPSLDVALILSGDAEVTLTVIGGRWSAETRSFVGDRAVETLQMHRADWAFLGACAVHPRLGLTSSAMGAAELKRAMMDCAMRRVLLAAPSDFDRIESCFVATLDQLDLVVTNLAPTWLDSQTADIEIQVTA